MKNFKKWTAAGAVVLALGLTSVTAFAAVESPAEIVAGLTGKSVEAVIAERTESGKTYGTLAADAGKLEEFQLRLFEEKKARVEERVQAGTMTEERAEAVLAAMETRQANCDGTGSGNMYGEANGNGTGVCDGTGSGNASGAARGNRASGSAN